MDSVKDLLRDLLKGANPIILLLLIFLVIMGAIFGSFLISQVTNHLPTQIKEVRTELKAEIKELRAEIKELKAEVRELDDKIEKNHNEIKNLIIDIVKS